jgi:hypothetical protein
VYVTCIGSHARLSAPAVPAPSCSFRVTAVVPLTCSSTVRRRSSHLSMPAVRALRKAAPSLALAVERDEAFGGQRCQGALDLLGQLSAVDVELGAHPPLDL